jgi:hypothetical protein
VLPCLFRVAALALLAALPAAVLSAAALPVNAIEFAPAVMTSLRDRYGIEETGVLRSAILTAVSHATEGVAVAPGLTVNVTVRDIAPSHPTPRQMADDPGVDVRFIGGADLSGEVRNAQGHVVANVMYRYYPPAIGLGSPAPDPWADARLAFDQFAAKLAAALRRIAPSPTPAS